MDLCLTEWVDGESQGEHSVLTSPPTQTAPGTPPTQRLLTHNNCCRSIILFYQTGRNCQTEHTIRNLFYSSLIFNHAFIPTANYLQNHSSTAELELNLQEKMCPPPLVGYTGILIHQHRPCGTHTCGLFIYASETQNFSCLGAFISLSLSLTRAHTQTLLRDIRNRVFKIITRINWSLCSNGLWYCISKTLIIPQC